MVTKVYPGSESAGLGQYYAGALDLIGKTVDYIDPSGSGNLLTGKVDSVSMSNDWPVVNIGTDTVLADNVLRIHESINSIDDSDAQAVAEAMVGKAIDYKDPLDPTKVLSGTVTGVSSQSGMAQLRIGVKLVDLEDVVRVYVPSAGA
jgi:ribosomal protein L35AE/L33A